MTTFVQGHSAVLRTHTELMICKSVLLKIMFVYCREPGEDLSRCCLKMQILFLDGCAKTCTMPFPSVREPGSLAQLMFCSVLPCEDQEAVFCTHDASHTWSRDMRKSLNGLITAKGMEGDTTQQLAPLHSHLISHYGFVIRTRCTCQISSSLQKKMRKVDNNTSLRAARPELISTAHPKAVQNRPRNTSL